MVSYNIRTFPQTIGIIITYSINISITVYIISLDKNSIKQG
jgi:hypothetical protein